MALELVFPYDWLMAWNQAIGGENLSVFAVETVRHSCAHVMASAIKKLYPDAKFGVGPAVDNGFYYDVELPTPLGQADLEKIEAEMRKISQAKTPICRSVHAIDEAIAEMSAMRQDFKVDLLQLLKTKGSTAVAKETGDPNAVTVVPGETPAEVTFYTIGDFVDLCRGPHVTHTGQIGHFKLTKVAGAYWRGDSKRQQLQRVYGLCFASAEQLKSELWRIEQQQLRDHRRLGRELEIFTLSPEIGSGLPLWLPNGTAMRDELEFLARQEERKLGYDRVSTPHITHERLYYQSGHLPYYEQDMYSPIDIDGEKFYLRPMNCPHHHHVYLSKPRSYRDLPVRLAEYGQVYRYEAHGVLSGLMRTRGFCQNDAHIYCRFNQAREEFKTTMDLHVRYYKLFNISEYHMRLSLPDLDKLDKYVNEPDKWLAALRVIRDCMAEGSLPYVEAEGEAAFYGPKVDFMIKSAIGTEYAISTNQLDFLATQRFGLSYAGEDGQQHPVYVIHRAPLGSHERFVAFLIEHYAGIFPVWLAPVQAMIVPISDRHLGYAKHIHSCLSKGEVHNGTGGLRVEIDDSSERMQKKIRMAQTKKIPYMIVVGDSEQDSGTVAVRLRSGKDLGKMPLEKLFSRLKAECETRADTVAE